MLTSDKHDSSNAETSNFDLDSELKKIEQEEQQRFTEKSSPAQWTDPNPNTFTKQQKQHTTILISGLTVAHDLFLQSAFRSQGYKMEAIDTPDNESLRYGREFGNRGQCNPTYFTVGNLVKHLTKLHQSGISKEDIINNYMFGSMASCGPCRFGTYVTEYRKALRDAGFEGFRVILFQQTEGMKQATGNSDSGIEFGPRFFWTVMRALVIGDVLNALGYRIRPYEIEAGATDRAIDSCKTIICHAFENKKSIILVLLKCRKLLSAINVDRTQAKPKVGIIGEFWAMTTEGDGNYHLQRFLENEGAEVDIQLCTNWAQYLLWQARYDTEERLTLRGVDANKENNGSRFGLQGVDIRKRLLMIKGGEKCLAGLFYTTAAIMGLKGYKLPNMHHIADVSHAFYDNNLRGGEGHMEVGKLITNIIQQKVNMTVSVKPFGCMPSSSVSDGVQSLITEMYPHGIFIPIETTGDGAVNVYSRLQMQLFKAKKIVANDVKIALQQYGLSEEDIQNHIKNHPAINHSFHKSPHHSGCVTADLIHEIGQAIRTPFWKKSFITLFTIFQKNNREDIVQTAQRAANKSKKTSDIQYIDASMIK